MAKDPRKNAFNKMWAFHITIWIAYHLPIGILRAIERSVAVIWHFFSRNIRSQVESNLTQVIGPDPKRVQQASRQLFINYADYLTDYTKWGMTETEKSLSVFCSVEGGDIFFREHAKGNGVILLAAHLGNWELGAMVFSHRGIPFNVVTAKEEAEQIANVRLRARGMHNIKTITIDDQPFFFIDIVNALKRNEIVAMLVDRYEKKNGLQVDFFGRQTYFPRGPVMIAQATGAALLPAATVLEKDGKYRTFVGEPVQLVSSGDKDKDMFENVSRIARVFEGYIRQYPEQWYNFSKLWR